MSLDLREKRSEVSMTNTTDKLGCVIWFSSQKLQVQQKPRLTHLKAGAQKKIVLGPARNK
jgi:hypothetical protein